MNTKRTAVLVGLVLVAISASAVASERDAGPPAPATSTTTTAPATSRAVVLEDDRGDVTKPKLDIQRVKVVNRADALEVRVYFPGVATTYDFPLGAVSVFLDTDETRRGPEYGHFMDFFSDYRFAVTDGWHERPTRAWGHSPEGRCVASAGVRSDRQSRLRWFEYVVTKSPGCFEAGAVRVAVTTINEGDLQPTVRYPRPSLDHLVARHAWSPWVPQS